MRLSTTTDNCEVYWYRLCARLSTRCEVQVRCDVDHRMVGSAVRCEVDSGGYDVRFLLGEIDRMAGCRVQDHEMSLIRW